VVAGVVCATVLLGLVMVARFLGMGEPSRTTDTSSDHFAMPSERIAFLARYVKMRSAARDAVFHVVYHDNSQGLPGPSDWSISAAMLVRPSDGPAWLEGAAPVSPPAPGAGAGPLRMPLPPTWRAGGEGTFYRRETTWLVWHPEGVIELSSTTF